MENLKEEVVKEEQNYGYYSKLLKKPYDTLAELKEAEHEYNVAHAKELEEKKKRKEDAETVKKAVTDRIAAQKKAAADKETAYKAYLKACDAADEELQKAKKAERDALAAFCKDHPEGFHDTINIDDVTYKYDYTANTHKSSDIFSRLVDSFLDF